jgi:hypothetical protein
MIRTSDGTISRWRGVLRRAFCLFGCVFRAHGERVDVVCFQYIEDKAIAGKVSAVEAFEFRPKIVGHISHGQPAQSCAQSSALRSLVGRTEAICQFLLIVCLANEFDEFRRTDTEVRENERAHSATNLVIANLPAGKFRPRNVDHARKHAQAAQLVSRRPRRPLREIQWRHGCVAWCHPKEANMIKRMPAKTPQKIMSHVIPRLITESLGSVGLT